MRALKAALSTLVLGGLLAGCGGSGGAGSAQAPPSLSSIQKVVVIFMENRSFDSLYGWFPGADGYANAGTFSQRSIGGTPYTSLPTGNSQIPAGLPVAPFDASKYFPADAESDLDITHQFYHEQAEIDGGKMDRFVAYGSYPNDPTNGAPVEDGIVMGYYDARTLPLGALAARYTLCDRFFHSAFGGSFLNHQWLVAARSPVFQPSVGDPPPTSDMMALLDASGLIIGNWGAILTPDGYAVNTCASYQLPHPKFGFNKTIPAQVHPTIGDRLDAKGVDWAWYSEDWDQVMSGLRPQGFQYHHQPFAFFKQYAPQSPGGKAHLLDLNRLDADLSAGRPLKPVTFVKFDGPYNEHPGYSIVAASEQRAADLVARIQASADWPNTLIVVTYDENGGLYDHVAPPVIDRWGPGSRVPAMLISPFARKGYVDHSTYETVSILRFLEERFELSPLTDRDAAPR